MSENLDRDYLPKGASNETVPLLPGVDGVDDGVSSPPRATTATSAALASSAPIMTQPALAGVFMSQHKTKVLDNRTPQARRRQAVAWAAEHAFAVEITRLAASPGSMALETIRYIASHHETALAGTAQLGASAKVPARNRGRRQG